MTVVGFESSPLLEATRVLAFGSGSKSMQRSTRRVPAGAWGRIGEGTPAQKREALSPLGLPVLLPQRFAGVCGSDTDPTPAFYVVQVLPGRFPTNRIRGLW